MCFENFGEETEISTADGTKSLKHVKRLKINSIYHDSNDLCFKYLSILNIIFLNNDINLSLLYSIILIKFEVNKIVRTKFKLN